MNEWFRAIIGIIKKHRHPSDLKENNCNHRCRPAYIKMFNAYWMSLFLEYIVSISYFIYMI